MFPRMEIWPGKTYPQYAKDLCCSDSTESLHNLDGSHPEKILGTQSREIPSKDEIQADNEG